eukprot:gene6160-6787_t
MGSSSSKQEEDDEAFIYDRRYISWDEKGNLHYGLEHPIERKRQLKEVLEIDFVDEEEGKTWYIMSSSWIASWLAYVHFARDIAPCPGPCRNDHLLQFDYVQGKYVGRFGLFMARNDRPGDYRRVSPEVWRKFQELYPGSGPTITMEYRKENKRETGEFDPAFWNVLDPPPPPKDQGNKKKKKKFLKISLGVKSKQKKAREEEEEKKKNSEQDVEEEKGEGEESKGDGEQKADALPVNSGISSLLKPVEPKTGPLLISTSMGRGEDEGSVKPRFSSYDTSSPPEDLAKRRESFFEKVYLKE